MTSRIISGIIIVLLVIPLVLVGGIFFKIGMIVLALLSLYELLKASGLDKKMPLIIRIIPFLILIIALYFKDTFFNVESIIASFFLFTIPCIILNNSKKYTIIDSLLVFSFVILIFLFTNSFIYIRDQSLYIFLYLLIVATLTDVFSYIFGRLFGKHKLTTISPKKTIEGSVYGLISGGLSATLFYYFLIGGSFINILLVSFFLSMMGELGDLFFSSIKRHFNIKDFSNSLPGHGGVLDRIDSLIFICMAYLLIIAIL